MTDHTENPSPEMKNTKNKDPLGMDFYVETTKIWQESRDLGSRIGWYGFSV